MNKTEKGMVLLNQIKTEHIIVTSLTWLTADIIIAGTSTGELLIVEASEVKAKISATDVDEIDIANINETGYNNLILQYVHTYIFIVYYLYHTNIE